MTPNRPPLPGNTQGRRLGGNIAHDGNISMRLPVPANDPRLPATPPRRPQGSGRRRWLKRLGITLGAIVAFALAGGAAVQIRLAKGPIPVSGLVAPLERGLSRELGDLSVRIGAALLQRSSRSGRAEFQLRDVRLVNAAGEVVARAPAAAIDISRNALWRGSVAPKKIELIRPRLVLSYEEGAGISLRFAGFQKPALPETPGQSSDASLQPDPSAPATAGGQEGETVGLVQVLKDAFRAARERRATTSFLKHVGIRDAVLIFRHKTHQTVWTAPRLGLALRHQKSRSILRGEGLLSHGGTPWEFAFEIDDTPARGAFQVRTLFRDLVPGAIARTTPALAHLRVLDTPLSGQAEFQLSNDGALAAASADVVLGAGRIRTNNAQQGDEGLLLDEGHAKISYSAEAGRLNIEKLDLLFGAGRIVLAGAVAPSEPANETNIWNYDLNGKMRFASATTSRLPPLANISLNGSADLTDGQIRVAGLHATWPQGSLAATGQISRSSGISLNGQIGEMPKAGLFEVWPPNFATPARTWLQSNVQAKTISGGRFSLSLPVDFIERIGAGNDIPSEALSLSIAAKDLRITYAPDMPPMQFADASVSIRGRSLRVKAPKGHMLLGSGAKLAFEHGDFVVPDMRQKVPDAQLFLKAQGKARSVLEFLKRAKLFPLGQKDIPAGLQGNASGILRFKFPLTAGLRREQIKLLGRVQFENGRIDNVFGGVDVAGASVVFDLSEKAVEAHGDLLLNGVPAKVRWLRLLGAPDENQPPLRISAKLDATDRTQLGLYINHIIEGVVAADVTIFPQAGKPAAVTVQADLSAAEIGLNYISWRKPPGQNARLQFDVVEGDQGLIELQNFKVYGDNIAIDGWVGLDGKNRLRKFVFPEAAFDVTTQMDIKGKLRPDNVWDIEVESSSFDGRPFFQNLFAPKRLTGRKPPPDKRRAGFDFRGHFKTMNGFFDASVGDLRVKMSRRREKLVSMEAYGTLDTGASIAIELKPNQGGPRILRGEAKDAGQAFRLVGFYNNIYRGESKLQVNLDDRSAADISGILWARNFSMQGDQYVTGVLQDQGKTPFTYGTPGSNTRNDKGGKRRVAIQFDQMRVNFSVGNGQFVLKDTFINGPALGATLSGKVDFERRRVNLGGTYIPLYGINAALGSVPILGQLFVGRPGEGVLGITFAVQGRLDKPDIIVNPVSLVAPGIFRTIFEITPQQQHITPRRQSPRGGTKSRPRSSSAPARSDPVWSSDRN